MRMRAAIETRTTHFFLSFSSALFLFPSLALPQLARTRRTGDGVRAQEFVLKRRSSCKHVSLRRRRRRPSPRKNVIVERRCAFKHITHSGHRRRVPLRNIAVECTSTTKACVGISIPSTHIRHQTRIPVWHRPVIITRRPVSAHSSYRCLIQTLFDECVPTRIGDWCKRSAHAMITISPTRPGSRRKELNGVVHVATVESAAASASDAGITVSIARLI